jgi:hypothetical protein
MYAKTFTANTISYSAEATFGHINYIFDAKTVTSNLDYNKNERSAFTRGGYTGTNTDWDNHPPQKKREKVHLKILIKVRLSHTAWKRARRAPVLKTSCHKG